jgi:hypothetical protein
MKPTPIAPTLNFEDVAKILGVCSKTVRKLRKTGKIGYVLVSDKMIRFRQADIEEFLDTNSQRQIGVNICATKNQIRRPGTTILSTKIVTFTDLQARQNKQDVVKSGHDEKARAKTPDSRP